jgi:DNA replication protein DnaC
VGTGKTFLGRALLAELLQQGMHCLYTRASSLVRSIQHTYHPHTHDTEQSTLKHFIVPDLLLIDEIGLQRHTESTLFLLSSEVLCERYDALKPTLLISNWLAALLRATYHRF